MISTARFFTIVCFVSLAACGSEAPSADPGTETGPCVEGECFSGLMCLSELCVDPDGGTDTESDPTSSTSSESAGPGSGSMSTSTVDPSLTSDPSSAEASSTECVPVEHTPCDDGEPNPFRAMGLQCPGEFEATTSSEGDARAIGVRNAFGTTEEWSPREGMAYAVIGSGLVAELDTATPADDMNVNPTHCNDDLGAEFDLGASLPAPLSAMNVVGDCVTDASLLGTGDCSNTLQGPFAQGGAANDYAELRVVADVPGAATSFAYEFAFFSTEYPFYYGSEFNDMFVAWLESERWTGNISFDENGNPVSITASFLEFRDDGGDLPEFLGTCMRQHGGTPWLSSVAPVAPGEQVTIVFAIFDLADSVLDAFVFLDGFRWGCDAIERPVTEVG